LKKILFALFSVAAILAGCQKDTGTNVTITSSDLASVNVQLKGTWVFPAETVSVVDSTGKAIFAPQSISAPALEFDGGSGVTIMPDIHSKLAGTYKLSSDKAFVYLDIYYPNGNDMRYQVILVDAHDLKLTSTQTFSYPNGGTQIPATSIINVTFQKQNAANASGKYITVNVQSDSVYNASVYVTHKYLATPADTVATLLNSKQNATGNYSYLFAVQSGDHLTADVFGSLTKTTVYAYYNGIPLTGTLNRNAGLSEIEASWDF
jgi:hypothetical protein